MNVVVASFWVHRPLDFPNKDHPVIAPYLDLLKVLDASAKRFGFDHLVLTDHDTAPQLAAAGIGYFAADLPRSLMQATTVSQACWLEHPVSKDVSSIFVGADCLIRRDFRDELPAGDLSVAYMKGHRRWRMNNGFVHIPAASRTRAARVWRSIADDTGPAMYEDMLAIERGLAPMPNDYGLFARRGLAVNFLPLSKWNRYMTDRDRRYPDAMEDAAEDANVLHFMGGWGDGKALMLKWARKYGFL